MACIYVHKRTVSFFSSYEAYVFIGTYLVPGGGDDGQIKGHGYQETGDGEIEGGKVETKLHEPT